MLHHCSTTRCRKRSGWSPQHADWARSRRAASALDSAAAYGLWFTRRLQKSLPRRGDRARSLRDQRRRSWSCRAAHGLQTAEQGDTVEKQDPSSAAEELTTEQKRENVVRLAFGGSEQEFTRFIE